MEESLSARLAKLRHFEWLIPALLCAILLLQLLSSVRQMSQHADESTHLYAGYRILKCGDYAYGREHPPLSKMLAAIPLAIEGAPLDCNAPPEGGEEADQAILWLYGQPNWWHLLISARVVASLFSVALLLAVWATARRMFGPMVAAVAAAFLAFEPNVLGHGALVLTDVLNAALFLLTVFAYYLWVSRRSTPYLLLTGFVLGLALLSKHSAPLLVILFLVLAVAEAWLQRKAGGPEWLVRARGNLAALAGIFALAAVVVWAGYGFRYSQEERRPSDAISPEHFAALNSPDVQILKFFRGVHLLPQAYLDGLIEAHALVRSSQGGVYAGRYEPTTPWYATPLALSIKLTIGMLGFALLGAWGVYSLRGEHARELLFLLLPLVLYMAAALLVNRTGGIRYLLPVVPLVVVLAAAGSWQMAQRARWAGIAIAVLLIAHVGSSLWCYPNYLSYANEAWGGPGNLYRQLPYTDIAQSYWQVSQMRKQFPDTPCWIDTQFFVRPAFYGIDCTPFGMLANSPLPERMDGLVFVSGSDFTQMSAKGLDLQGFAAATPFARLGGSAMLVFRGSYDSRLLSARYLENRANQLLSAGRFEEALIPARQAVETAPESAYARGWYCSALAANGRVQEGLGECMAGRTIATRDPNQGWTATLLDRMMTNISREFGVPLPAGVQPTE